eukprot:220389_1
MILLIIRKTLSVWCDVHSISNEAPSNKYIVFCAHNLILAQSGSRDAAAWSTEFAAILYTLKRKKCFSLESTSNQAFTIKLQSLQTTNNQTCTMTMRFVPAIMFIVVSLVAMNESVGTLNNEIAMKQVSEMYKDLFDLTIVSVGDLLCDFRRLNGIPVVEGAYWSSSFHLDSVYPDYNQHNDSIMIGGTVNDTWYSTLGIYHFLSVKVRITGVEGSLSHDKEKETRVTLWFDSHGQFRTAIFREFGLWSQLPVSFETGNTGIESIARMIKGQSLEYEHRYNDEYDSWTEKSKLFIITRHDLNRTTVTKSIEPP